MESGVSNLIQTFEAIELYPKMKSCKKCRSPLTTHIFQDQAKHFICQACKVTTCWNNDTSLQNMLISLSRLEILLNLFVVNSDVNLIFVIGSVDRIGSIRSYRIEISITQN